jgi:hypothetical protein
MKLSAEEQVERAERLANILADQSPQMPPDPEDAEKRLERLIRRIEKVPGCPVRKGYLNTKQGREQLFNATQTYLEMQRIREGHLTREERRASGEYDSRREHWGEIFWKELKADCLIITRSPGCQP